MKKLGLFSPMPFRLEIKHIAQILISCILLISLIGKFNIQDFNYLEKIISSSITVLIFVLLINIVGENFSRKKILLILFAPSFFIINSIYNLDIKIEWDLFLLSLLIILVGIKYRNVYLLLIALLVFLVCLYFDIKIIFLTPIFLYFLFSYFSVNKDVKKFLVISIPFYVVALLAFRSSFVFSDLHAVDYFFILLNFFVACTPLFLNGFPRHRWALSFISILGVTPLILLGLPFYSAIGLFINAISLSFFLNDNGEKISDRWGWQTIFVLILGATLWALPSKDSTHFRAGIFEGIFSKLSASSTPDPLGHPFWHRVGKQYSSAIIGNFYPVQKRVNRDDFIFYFKRASNIQHVENKNSKNWQRLSSTQLGTSLLYILDDWASNPELVIFFDPRRDLLAEIDGYSVFVPGWVACKDGCPEVTKGLPLDWKIFKSWPEVEGGLLIERIPPEFDSSGAIYFDSAGKGLPILLAGWSSPEDWGIWTKSFEAGLLVPYVDHHKKHLVLNVRALISAKHPLQKVSVLLDGVFQKTFELTKGEGNLLKIDLAALPTSSKHFVVELKIHNPVSPNELGLGEDARKLGVGLVSAKFE